MDEEWVPLPDQYENWPRLRRDLHTIADGRGVSLEVLKEVLERNGHRYGLPLLRKVLKKRDYFTTEHFCCTQLPWLARKALEVEDLFKVSGGKLKVSCDETTQ